MKLKKYKLSLMLLFGFSMQGGGSTAVQKKNAALAELYQQRRDPRNFIEKLLECKSTFLRNEVHPQISNAAKLKTKIDRDNKLFSEIAREYCIKRKPAWMKNLFQHILSDQRNEELGVIMARISSKNAAFAKLFNSKRSGDVFIEELLQYEELFQLDDEANEHYEQKWENVLNGQKLKEYLDSGHKKDELFGAIVQIYYETGKPVWIEQILQHILSEARMKELLSKHPKTVLKNKILEELYGLRDNINEFVKKLLKCAEIFQEENEQHKPTSYNTEAKSCISGNSELFNTVAKRYHAQGKPRWMKCVLSHILSDDRNAELMNINYVIAAKNLALIRLYGLRSNLDEFGKQLPECAEIFQDDNKKHEPTYNTEALKSCISGNSELFNKIVAQYYAQGKPIFIRNLFDYILPAAGIEALPSMHPKVIAKNKALQGLKAAPYKSEFVEKLMKCEELFGPDNKKYKPTVSTNELKAKIDKDPELFSKIAGAYFEKGKPIWMQDMFEYILSQERMNALPSRHPKVIAKNNVLHLVLTDQENFIEKLLENKELFGPENKKHEPTTGAIKAKIDKNPQLFSKIGDAYYKNHRPEWMKDALQYILSEVRMKELLDTNPVVFEKNVALIALFGQKPTSWYCVPNNNRFIEELLKYEQVFGPENKGHKLTWDTKELKDYIDGNLELFNKIAEAYYKNGEPEWMKEILEHILPEARMQELLENSLVVFQKNLALIEFSMHSLESKLPQLKDLFAMEKRVHKPTFDTSELKTKIDQRPELFDKIAKVYFEQGEPKWMRYLLPYILSELRMVEMLGSKAILRTSSLDKFIDCAPALKIIDACLITQTKHMSKEQLKKLYINQTPGTKRKHGDAFGQGE